MNRNHEHRYQAQRPNPTVLVCSCGRFQHVNPVEIIEEISESMLPCHHGGNWHNWLADGTCTDCDATRND